MRSRTVRLLVLSTVLLLGAALVAGAVVAAGPAQAQPASAAQARSIRIVVGRQSTTVTPVLDGSRSSSATLGSAGGTLATTAADGSTLQLTLPPNALAGNERLTMTPLVQIAGAGVKFVAGAQLAPAGLRLLKPGQLVIHPAHPVSRARQIAFGYQGSGTQFGLVPLALQSRIAIPLLSLGGAGLASATSGQLSAREHRPPSDPTAAWLQQLSLPLDQQRNKRALRSDRQTVIGLLAGYYDGYVKPLLRRPGSSVGAWRLAAARSLGWEREEQMLGYARRFSAGEERLRTAVFRDALRKRWGPTVSACNGGSRTLGRLQTALQLARTAQIVGQGSRIGGRSAIAAGLQSCGQLGIQATLDPTQVNWQSGLSSDYISQDVVTAQTAGAPLQLQQLVGANQFAFAAPHVAVTERVTSWTLAPAYAARGCTTPSFLGFTPDPDQMYGAFAATLTIPADLFLAAQPPPATVAVTVTGADLASWSTICPPGQTIAFSQPPGAMAGMAAVTGATPILSSRTTSTTTTKFAGSADILAGSTITGYANDNGNVTVTVPR
jgi:hypothetical protein